MNQVIIELQEVKTGWVASASGCLSTPIRRKYEHALDLAKKEFLKTRNQNKDPLIDDYRKALDKKTGNKPTVKFTGTNERGYRRIQVIYSLRPPAIWKQRGML